MEPDVTRKADLILENDSTGLEPKVSSDTFTKEFAKVSENSCEEFMQASASSYTLADERSQLSSDIEHWMSGHVYSTESAGVQDSRTPLPTIQRSTSPNIGILRSTSMGQRSTLARSSSLDHFGLWYILAMMLPLFSINNYDHWRYTPRFLPLMLYLCPSIILSTAELFVSNLSSVCVRVRAHVQRLAQDQLARELFATAMDIVLVIYAIGFLVLSIYQASIYR